MKTGAFVRAAVLTSAGVIVFALGVCAARAHETADSRLEELTHRLAREPGRADLYIQRGELHRLRGETAEAEADFDAARRAGSPAADLAQARLLAASGRHAAARPLVDRYLAARGSDPEGFVVRAGLRQHARDFDGAVKDLDEAVAAAWASGAATPELYLQRADAIVSATQRAPSSTAERDRNARAVDRALSGLDDGAARLGAPAVLVLKAIEMERIAGRLDAALHRVETAPEHSLAPATRALWRARLLDAAGRPREGREAWQALDALLGRIGERRELSPDLSAMRREARAALAREPERSSEDR